MTDDSIKRNKKIHIGLIPDGNRRYALKLGKPVWFGHKLGAEKIKEFLNWCTEYPQIRTISIFLLSTENLRRPKRELEELWKLYKMEFKRILKDENVKRKQIKINVFGNDGVWKPDIKQLVKQIYESTKHYSRYILNLLLAYGSKFELMRAVSKMTGKVKDIEKFLFVKEPLDLVIRTGGQRRLSNFMLYQACYAEIYFSDTLWPEFSKKEFDEIMKWYFVQQKKFGQ